MESAGCGVMVGGVTGTGLDVATGVVAVGVEVGEGEVVEAVGAVGGVGFLVQLASTTVDSMEMDPTAIKRDHAAGFPIVHPFDSVRLTS